MTQFVFSRTPFCVSSDRVEMPRTNIIQQASLRRCASIIYLLSLSPWIKFSSRSERWNKVCLHFALFPGEADLIIKFLRLCHMSSSMQKFSPQPASWSIMMERSSCLLVIQRTVKPLINVVFSSIKTMLHAKWKLIRIYDDEEEFCWTAKVRYSSATDEKTRLLFHAIMFQRRTHDYD